MEENEEDLKMKDSFEFDKVEFDTFAWPIILKAFEEQLSDSLLETLDRKLDYGNPEVFADWLLSWKGKTFERTVKKFYKTVVSILFAQQKMHQK